MKKFRVVWTFILAAMFACATGNTQNSLQDKAGKEMRELAQTKTDYWKKELRLTGKQVHFMEQKILEYLLKKETLLLSKMQEEEKQKRILALQEQKDMHMEEILSKPQHERYLLLQQQNFTQKVPRDSLQYPNKNKS